METKKRNSEDVDVLTETLAAIQTPFVALQKTTTPGAYMIQFPALLPGMPAPPAIPALPGMEKVPPPPGVKIVDATGKVVIAGPMIAEAIPKPPALPGLPEVAPPKEKLGEEEVERLLEKEELEQTKLEAEILEEREGGIEVPPSEEEVSGEELTLESIEIEEVETGMEEGELSGEELVM